MKARAAIERLMMRYEEGPYSDGTANCAGCRCSPSYGQAHKPDCWVMEALAELDQLAGAEPQTLVEWDAFLKDAIERYHQGVRAVGKSYIDAMARAEIQGDKAV